MSCQVREDYYMVVRPIDRSVGLWDRTVFETAFGSRTVCLGE